MTMSNYVYYTIKSGFFPNRRITRGTGPRRIFRVFVSDDFDVLEHIEYSYAHEI